MSTHWTPLVLAVAPNGAYKTKKDHPALPMTTKEIAETAARCRDAGAAMIHLHVRDHDGLHLLDEHAYRASTAAISRAVGTAMVVQITTEAAGRYRREEQMSVVRAVRPEAVSLALREIVPDALAEADAAEFFGWLDRERIMKQTILYDTGDVARYVELRRRGVLGERRDFPLFVLGRYVRGQLSSPRDLLAFLAAYPGDDAWAMCAFGLPEQACALAAAALGGHVRIGFENNLHNSDGTLAGDNSEPVRRAAEGARFLARPLATADDLRDLYS